MNRVLVPLLLVSCLCFAQKTKPLPVSFTVESEGQNIAWPVGVRQIGRMDLTILTNDIREALLKDKDAIQLVDAQATGNQLHVNLVVAQLNDRWYIASSALEFGDEKASGLLSHNVLIQPSLQKLASNVVLQVEGLRLQGMLGTLKR